MNINEIRALNVEELSNELKDSESALMNLRFKTVAMLSVGALLLGSQASLAQEKRERHW